MALAQPLVEKEGLRCAMGCSNWHRTGVIGDFFPCLITLWMEFFIEDFWI
ncbi:hypothetical protein [Nostoc sp. MG11]|nr:hypothetical protein [Nostoc sp. MG11]